MYALQRHSVVSMLYRFNYDEKHMYLYKCVLNQSKHDFEIAKFNDKLRDEGRLYTDKGVFMYRPVTLCATAATPTNMFDRIVQPLNRLTTLRWQRRLAVTARYRALMSRFADPTCGVGIPCGDYDLIHKFHEVELLQSVLSDCFVPRNAVSDYDRYFHNLLRDMGVPLHNNDEWTRIPILCLQRDAVEMRVDLVNSIRRAPFYFKQAIVLAFESSIYSFAKRHQRSTAGIRLIYTAIQFIFGSADIGELFDASYELMEEEVSPPNDDPTATFLLRLIVEARFVRFAELLGDLRRRCMRIRSQIDRLEDVNENDRKARTDDTIGNRLARRRSSSRSTNVDNVRFKLLSSPFFLLIILSL